MPFSLPSIRKNTCLHIWYTHRKQFICEDCGLFLMLDTSTIPTAFPYPFEPHMHDPTATVRTWKNAYHLDILIILNARCLAGSSSRLKITAFVSCLIILDGHQKRKN